jgi:hypothetical protein
MAAEGARPLWLGLVGTTAVALIFVVMANLSQGPLAGLRDRPYIGRIATMMDTGAGTNAVRVLIWEGVVAIIGAGPITTGQHSRH